MKIKNYDTFIMGHISIDENIYQGESVKEIGGAGSIHPALLLLLVAKQAS